MIGQPLKDLSSPAYQDVVRANHNGSHVGQYPAFRVAECGVPGLTRAEFLEIGGLTVQ